jgi:DNA integrity scanning protein DisA with diadenylate cyclase activity/mannitol/fructose-specific phosphotransferase system IIA component (Ntr-type)
MALREYLTIPLIVDLKPGDKAQALEELVRTLCKTLRVRKQKQIMDEILKREDSASTYIGQGVALPHARVPIEPDFAVAVGRCLAGIPYDAARGAQAQIIVLLLTKDTADRPRHLEMLSEIAALFKSSTIRDTVLAADVPLDLRKVLTGTRSTKAVRTQRTTRRHPEPVLATAARLASEIKAKHIVVFADTVAKDDFLNQLRPRSGKVMIVCSNKSRFDPADKRIHAVVNAPSFPSSRFDQMKIGILLALSRNLLNRNDKVVCVSGNPKKGVFDTLVILDIAAEYEFFFTNAQNILPPDVKPEVLERVLAFAAEIALEGREGKPIGTIFVVGDTNTVNGFVRQLIINPFRGYTESERNVLDPGLDETIKEFASIDGAFIVTGDGVVLSAGSYLRPQAVEVESLPSGFGARHAAAAGITACTNALAITVSESTGMVSLFKNGVILMTISKPVVQDRGVVQKML